MLLPACPPQLLHGLLQSSGQRKPTPDSTSLPRAPPPAGSSMENKAGGQSWGKAAGPGPGEVEFRPRQPQLLPAAAMGPRLPHEERRNAARAPSRGPGWGLQPGHQGWRSKDKGTQNSWAWSKQSAGQGWDHPALPRKGRQHLRHPHQQGLPAGRN